jgi:hypothetical protein
VAGSDAHKAATRMRFEQELARARAQRAAVYGDRALTGREEGSHQLLWTEDNHHDGGATGAQTAREGGTDGRGVGPWHRVGSLSTSGRAGSPLSGRATQSMRQSRNGRILTVSAAADAAVSGLPGGAVEPGGGQRPPMWRTESARCRADVDMAVNTERRRADLGLGTGAAFQDRGSGEQPAVGGGATSYHRAGGAQDAEVGRSQADDAGASRARQRRASNAIAMLRQTAQQEAQDLMGGAKMSWRLQEDREGSAASARGIRLPGERRGGAQGNGSSDPAKTVDVVAMVRPQQSHAPHTLPSATFWDDLATSGSRSEARARLARSTSDATDASGAVWNGTTGHHGDSEHASARRPFASVGSAGPRSGAEGARSKRGGGGLSRRGGGGLAAGSGFGRDWFSAATVEGDEPESHTPQTGEHARLGSLSLLQGRRRGSVVDSAVLGVAGDPRPGRADGGGGTTQSQQRHGSDSPLSAGTKLSREEAAKVAALQGAVYASASVSRRHRHMTASSRVVVASASPGGLGADMPFPPDSIGRRAPHLGAMGRGVGGMGVSAVSLRSHASVVAARGSHGVSGVSRAKTRGMHGGGDRTLHTDASGATELASGSSDGGDDALKRLEQAEEPRVSLSAERAAWVALPSMRGGGLGRRGTRLGAASPAGLDMPVGASGSRRFGALQQAGAASPGMGDVHSLLSGPSVIGAQRLQLRSRDAQDATEPENSTPIRARRAKQPDAAAAGAVYGGRRGVSTPRAPRVPRKAATTPRSDQASVAVAALAIGSASVRLNPALAGSAAEAATAATASPLQPKTYSRSRRGRRASADELLAVHTARVARRMSMTNGDDAGQASSDRDHALAASAVAAQTPFSGQGSPRSTMASRHPRRASVTSMGSSRSSSARARRQSTGPGGAAVSIDDALLREAHETQATSVHRGGSPRAGGSPRGMSAGADIDVTGALVPGGLRAGHPAAAGDGDGDGLTHRPGVFAGAAGRRGSVGGGGDGAGDGRFRYVATPPARPRRQQAPAAQSPRRAPTTRRRDSAGSLEPTSRARGGTGHARGRDAQAARTRAPDLTGRTEPRDISSEAFAGMDSSASDDRDELQDETQVHRRKPSGAASSPASTSDSQHASSPIAVADAAHTHSGSGSGGGDDRDHDEPAAAQNGARRGPAVDVTDVARGDSSSAAGSQVEDSGSPYRTDHSSGTSITRPADSGKHRGHDRGLGETSTGAVADPQASWEAEAGSDTEASSQDKHQHQPGEARLSDGVASSVSRMDREPRSRIDRDGEATAAPDDRHDDARLESSRLRDEQQTRLDEAARAEEEAATRRARQLMDQQYREQQLESEARRLAMEASLTSSAARLAPGGLTLKPQTVVGWAAQTASMP